MINARFVIVSLFVSFVLTNGHGQLVPQDWSNMKLVWSDEFTIDGLPDPKKWSYSVGDGCPELCGWGNNELQYYTDSNLDNARVKNGFLIIEARNEKTESRDFSSARLISRGKGDWTYGRIVVRAKLPKGKGVWPAIWMLPSDESYGGWPASGEIDIMEFVGYIPDSIYGSIHTKSFNHIAGTQVTAGVQDPTVSQDFHEYAIQWDEKSITFYFDNIPYQRFENNGSGSDAWPFDKPFHLVLNVAVGGNWGGKKGVDPNIWPQKMLIDWVRVYQ